MIIDYGGFLDGRKAFRITQDGQEPLNVETIYLLNVYGSLHRQDDGGGVLEVEDGMLAFTNEACTAVVITGQPSRSSTGATTNAEAGIGRNEPLRIKQGSASGRAAPEGATA